MCSGRNTVRWEISFTFPERSLYGSTRLKGYKVVSKCSAFVSTTVWSSSRNLALDCLNDVSSMLLFESDRSHLITKISSGLMILLPNLKGTKRSRLSRVDSLEFFFNVVSELFNECVEIMRKYVKSIACLFK